MKKKTTIRNTLLTLGIFLAAAALSIPLESLGVEEHITTLFVFAVFLISLLTDGFFYGITSSIAGVLAINYAFTYPYFVFDFLNTVNLVSAIIMMAVSILTGILTTRIKKLSAAQEESEKERMRANLLRAVSHDLRTPLTTIYGASSTLRTKRDMLTSEQQDTMLKNMEEDAKWLIHMVENLLSVTKISGGQIELKKTTVILDELIDSVLTKFMNRYPDQNVVLDIPEDMVMLDADPILIEQVLMNLMENAVVHAKDMTYISFRSFTLGPNVVFEVADNGCGIKDDRLKSIFSGSFETGETSADAKKRNIGIGLSVCATIIKAHGGEITAENRKGGGALFRFTLNKQEDILEDE